MARKFKTANVMNAYFVNFTGGDQSKEYFEYLERLVDYNKYSSDYAGNKLLILISSPQPEYMIKKNFEDLKKVVIEKITTDTLASKDNHRLLLGLVERLHKKIQFADIDLSQL